MGCGCGKSFKTSSSAVRSPNPNSPVPPLVQQAMYAQRKTVVSQSVPTYPMASTPLRRVV